MSIVLRITDAGRAALVNARQDGTNAVRIDRVGVSPAAIVAAPNTAVLPGEVKRIGTISGAGVARDVIHLIVRDETADTYTVRSLALYLSDGTLFASYGQAEPIIEKSAGALLLLAIDATLLDVAANQITFGDSNFLNPAATTETAGVVELATDQEATGLADPLRALTPRGMAAIFTAANVLSRLLTIDGAGSGLDADLLDGRDASFFLPASTFNAGQILAQLLSVDGSGSGLDADLLDGRDASYFMPAGSFTGAQILALLLGVDGSGSGLDADLLDGLDSSVFARRGGDEVFRDVFASRGADSGVVFLGTSGAHYLIFDGSNYSLQAANLLINGGLAWHSANDGSGSGLDADLLDGLEGAAYAKLGTAANFAALFGTGLSTSGNVFLGGANSAVIFNDGGPRVQLTAPARLGLFSDFNPFERAYLAGDHFGVWGGMDVGTGVTITGSGNLRAATDNRVAFTTFGTDDYTAIQFVRGVSGTATQVGSVTIGLSSTSYNTASDYRLKENMTPIIGALERVMSVPALRFNFRAEPEKTVDGFLAHEFGKAVPEAVHGVKDGVEDIGTATPPAGTDELPLADIPVADKPKGWRWVRTGTRPVYQAIDQSKGMPLLWAAVQELAAKNEALESRIADLVDRIDTLETAA